MTTVERIRATIAAALEVPTDAVTTSATLAEMTGLDSLKLVEMIAALDDEFGIHLPSEELGDLETVDDVVRLVVRFTAV